MRLRWTPEAADELEAACHYLARQRPEAARRLAQAVVDATERLRRHPMLGRSGRVFGTRELVVTDTPYRVIYELRHDAVSILRVLHGARLWPTG